MTDKTWTFDSREDTNWTWEDGSIEELLYTFLILRETNDPKVREAGDIFGSAAEQWLKGGIGNEELIRVSTAVSLMAGRGEKTYTSFDEAYEDAGKIPGPILHGR